MSKTESVKQNYEFRRAYARGKSYVSPALVVYIIRNRAGCCRLGITCSKKIGNAVSRNRARRLIKAAACKFINSSDASFDVIIVARPAVLTYKSDTLAPIIGKALSAGGVIHR